MNAGDFLDLYTEADPVNLDSLARQVMTHAKANGLAIRTPRWAFTFARTDGPVELWHVTALHYLDDDNTTLGAFTDPESAVRRRIVAAFAEDAVRIDKEASNA